MPYQSQANGKQVVEGPAIHGGAEGRHFMDDNALYFERGGPYYRLMQRIGWVQGEDLMIRKRIVGFLALTWFPLLIFSILEGRALGPTSHESFLLDFTTYARYFIALPILIAAEAVIGPRLRIAALHIVEGGFIQERDHPAFDRAVARVIKWRESSWPELIILGIALGGASTLTFETLDRGEATTSWYTVLGRGIPAMGISLTGLWYHIIAIPLLQFLLYRWLWRLMIWTRFLYDLSRLDLALVPNHADEAGGLGFLGNAHLSLGIIALGFGSVLSANAAFRIIFDGATIEAFKISFLTLLMVCQMLVLGPLLLFMPILAKKKREWIRIYGTLVLHYNRAFHEKWIEGKVAEDEPLLGSGDIQSLADLGNSFNFIQSMKYVPFDPKVMLRLAVITALPGLPLVLLIVPIDKVLATIAGAVF